MNLRTLTLTGEGYISFNGIEYAASYKVEADQNAFVLNVSIWNCDFEPPIPGTEEGLFLFMEDGRRVHLKVGEDGALQPNSPIQEGRDDRAWVKADNAIPLKKAWILTVRSNLGLVHQSERPTLEEARSIYEQITAPSDFAEIRPLSGKVIRLK